MKGLFGWWLFSCVIIGYAQGDHIRHCPYDDRSTVFEIAVTVAVWPAMLVRNAMINQTTDRCFTHMAN